MHDLKQRDKRGELRRKENKMKRKENNRKTSRKTDECKWKDKVKIEKEVYLKEIKHKINEKTMKRSKRIRKEKNEK